MGVSQGTPILIKLTMEEEDFLYELSDEPPQKVSSDVECTEIVNVDPIQIFIREDYLRVSINTEYNYRIGTGSDFNLERLDYPISSVIEYDTYKKLMYELEEVARIAVEEVWGADSCWIRLLTFENIQTAHPLSNPAANFGLNQIKKGDYPTISKIPLGLIITIKLPDFHIVNSFTGDTHLIQGGYFIGTITISSFNNERFTFTISNHFYRTKFICDEIYSDYSHSHANSGGYYLSHSSANLGGKLCLGASPLATIAKNFREERDSLSDMHILFKTWAFALWGYIQEESAEGGPYQYFRDIRSITKITVVNSTDFLGNDYKSAFINIIDSYICNTLNFLIKSPNQKIISIYEFYGREVINVIDWEAFLRIVMVPILKPVIADTSVFFCSEQYLDLHHKRNGRIFFADSKSIFADSKSIRSVDSGSQHWVITNNASIEAFRERLQNIKREKIGVNFKDGAHLVCITDAEKLDSELEYVFKSYDIFQNLKSKIIDMFETVLSNLYRYAISENISVTDIILNRLYNDSELEEPSMLNPVIQNIEFTARIDDTSNIGFKSVFKVILNQEILSKNSPSTEYPLFIPLTEYEK